MKLCGTLMLIIINDWCVKIYGALMIIYYNNGSDDVHLRMFTKGKIMEI